MPAPPPFPALLHASRASDRPLEAAVARVAAASRAWHAEQGPVLLERAEQALPHGAPPRLREALGIQQREVPLNRTLGWLLDPSASHGAGPLVLASFARWLGAHALADDAARARAWCESRPEGWFGGREPDLLFRTPGAVLLVENKVNAPEGPRQFLEYAVACEKWAGPRPSRTLVVMAPAHRDVPPPYGFRTHRALAAWAAGLAEDPLLPTWVRLVLLLLATDLEDAGPSERRLRTIVERSREGPATTADLVHLAHALDRPRATPWEKR